MPAPHPNGLPASGESKRATASPKPLTRLARRGRDSSRPRWEGEWQAPRLSPAAGISLHHLDLAHPLARTDRDRVWRALLDHHVVVFPGQALTREQQYAFTAQFGEVENHGGGAPGKRREVAHVTANLDADGNPSDRFAKGANYRWHTDKPYYREPPLLTTLYAVELPPEGGDTEFANTALAYAALPQATKARIDGLRVVFQWEAGRRAGYYANALPPVDHPLVRTHPETGEKALYLGNHAQGIAGLPETEGAALLGELLRHATQPEFTYTHRWRLGDLVMWDNRCLLHRAVANYAMTRYRRVMHRNVVRGAMPV